MIENTDQLQPPAQRRLSTNALTHQRLSGRHFIQKIPNSGQKRPINRSCVVCGPAEKQLLKRVGEKRKRPGTESSYECKECGVTLCVDPCFTLYYNYTDFVRQYISMKFPSEE